MPGALVFRQRDYDGDPQQVKVDTIDVTAATDYADWTTRVTALNDALEAATIGNPDGADFVSDAAILDGSPAASPIAQKSTQMIIQYKDNATDKTYFLRVGMPDLSQTAIWDRQDGLTVMKTDQAVYTNLKTTLEDVGVHITPAGAQHNITVGKIFVRE